MATVGAFHAYFIDLSQFNSYCKGRYILTFADSGVADCWWRVVSENDSLKKYNLRRMRPQYYVGSLKDQNGFDKVLHEPLRASLDEHDTLSSLMFVREFAYTRDKYRGGCHETADCIPLQEVLEYRSGTCYYIRSKATPHHYWHLQHGYVQISHTERTQFCIARALGDKGSFLARDTMTGYGTIMIPHDRIIIAAVDQNTGQLSGGICPLNELYGPLAYRQRVGSENAYGNHDFKLEELLTKRCFRVLRAEGNSLVSYNLSSIGEDWELV
ncbi:hypothetical protein BDZ91DRAFT_716064 [Kalaharituber pfeilii]|nr:hypothetical protein BDZ91DRAFT_716064 [Kalaharituber pfeilii]